MPWMDFLDQDPSWFVRHYIKTLGTLGRLHQIFILEVLIILKPVFCTKECKAEEGKEFLKYCVIAIQFSVCYAFIACIYLCMYVCFILPSCKWRQYSKCPGPDDYPAEHVSIWTSPHFICMLASQLETVLQAIPIRSNEIHNSRPIFKTTNRIYKLFYSSTLRSHDIIEWQESCW